MAIINQLNPVDINAILHFNSFLGKECCDRILVKSSDYAKERYPSAMGVYHRQRDSRHIVYKRTSEKGLENYFLSAMLDLDGWQVSK